MQQMLVSFIPWLNQYGSFAIFVLLALGIIAFPVPEESLMVFSGLLMAKGTLLVVPTVIAAIAGALCGISTTYVIGLVAGTFLIRKWGKWVGITDMRVERVHIWFERIGKWTLFIGYFIPGVRHLTGYVAGSVRLEFHEFALFAYLGGIIWASLFLAIGYFFSEQWVAVFQYLHLNVISKLY